MGIIGLCAWGLLSVFIGKWAEDWGHSGIGYFFSSLLLKKLS